jgi:HEAT repeat protein
VRSAPQNSDLPKKLRELAYDPDATIRSLALTSLGSLHHAEDIEFLREYAKSAVDPNLQNEANSAVETIVGFVTEQ